MNRVVSFLLRLAAPVPSVTDLDIRRDSTMLLVITSVSMFLVLVMLATLPYQSLIVYDTSVAQFLRRIAPLLLLVLFAFLVAVWTLAKTGHYAAGGRLIVVGIYLTAFWNLIANHDQAVLEPTVVPILFCALLLTPWDSAVVYLATVAGYFLAPHVVGDYADITVPHLLLSIVSVTAVGATAMIVTAMRARDRRKIGRQSDELKRTHDEVVQLRKMEALAVMSSGIAHEFNNILAAITIYAEVIERRAENPNRTYARDIQKAGKRAVQLIDQLLSFSQQQTLDAEYFDLDDWIKSDVTITDLIRTQPDRIHLRFSLESKPVHLDPLRLAQALSVLVGNLMSDLPAGGSIVIATKTETLRAGNRFNLRPGAYVVLRLEDDGTGWDEETSSRQFEPFFTSGEFGSGRLDLASVYGFLQQSGGHILTLGDSAGGRVYAIAVPYEEESA